MGQVVGGILGGMAARRMIAGVVTGIGTLFKSRLGLFITSAMLWLGINFATIKLAVEPAIDMLYSYAQSSGGGQYGAIAMQWMGVLNLDKAITMIGSAVMMKHAVMQGRLYLFKRGFGAKP